MGSSEVRSTIRHAILNQEPSPKDNVKVTGSPASERQWRAAEFPTENQAPEPVVDDGADHLQNLQSLRRTSGVSQGSSSRHTPRTNGDGRISKVSQMTKSISDGSSVASSRPTDPVELLRRNSHSNSHSRKHMVKQNSSEQDKNYRRFTDTDLLVDRDTLKKLQETYDKHHTSRHNRVTSSLKNLMISFTSRKTMPVSPSLTPRSPTRSPNHSLTPRLSSTLATPSLAKRRVSLQKRLRITNLISTRDLNGAEDANMSPDDSLGGSSHTGSRQGSRRSSRVRRSSRHSHLLDTPQPSNETLPDTPKSPGTPGSTFSGQRRRPRHQHVVNDDLANLLGMIVDITEQMVVYIKHGSTSQEMA